MALRKASIRAQAWSIASTFGHRSMSRLKRRALSTCGTTYTSANVGAPSKQIATLRVGGQERLQRVESVNDPPGTPALRGNFVGAEVMPQRFEYPTIVDGVDVAGDARCEGTHSGAGIRVRRQECRRGMAFLQSFNDGRCLNQHTTIVDESRDQALGVEHHVLGAPRCSSVRRSTGTCP